MKTIKIISGFFIALFFNSCDNTPDNEVIINPEPNRIIITTQYFSYKNAEGKNLFEQGVYNKEYLSLIATDEQWNDLYVNNQRVADIENLVEIRNKSLDKNGNIIALELRFGYDLTTDVTTESAIGYYKLEYNKDKYDTITVFYFKNNIHFYITKVIYNNVEYDTSQQPIIEIIKEE